MRSWKTTVSGAGGLVAVLCSVLDVMLDNDPTTNPDWNIIVPVVFASISSACVGFFARDNNVTSEEAGAVKPEAKL